MNKENTEWKISGTERETSGLLIMSIVLLPTEILTLILQTSVDSVRSVNVISQVCRYWRGVVYGMSWGFHGYLPVRILELFPNLPAPEAFFCITDVREGAVTIDDIPDGLETGKYVSESLKRVREWVQRNRIRKLRLHIAPLSHDSYLRSNEDMSSLFWLLLEDGVEDLLIRGVHGTWLQQEITGLWYQKVWNGESRMVVGMPFWAYVRALVYRLEPSYLVVQNLYSEGWLQEVPESVRILGVGSDLSMGAVASSQWARQLREVRILSSDSLVPWAEEEYTVGSMFLENHTPVRPNIMSFRGAIYNVVVPDALRVFPGVPEWKVQYKGGYRESWEQKVCIPIIRDPRVSPFVPTFTLKTFWSKCPSAIRCRIAQHLSCRDLMHFSQVLRSRNWITDIPTPTIPASILRTFSSQVTYCGLVTISNHEDIQAFSKMFGDSRERVQVATDELLHLVLEAIVKKRLSYDWTFHQISITLLSDPKALITLSDHLLKITAFLPSRFSQWPGRFSERIATLICHGGTGDNHNQETTIVTWNFY